MQVRPESVLLVKLSSLGDIVHAFPAISDFSRQFPQAEITWAVDSFFAALPLLHPAVREVMSVPLRRVRQRSSWWWFGGEWQAFWRSRRVRTFSHAIDAQGLIKSAVLQRMISAGERIGPDRHSAREGLAALLYGHKVAVPYQQHAVLRNKMLFARAFGYDFVPDVDFGLPQATGDERDTVLFLHGTTWPSKALPLTVWQDLARCAADAGFRVYLPWGNVQEREQAARIAAAAGVCEVLPAMSIAQLALLMGKVGGVVSVDTGLGHLAGAYGVPVVGIYGATSAELAGISGTFSQNLVNPAPCLQRDCRQHGADTANACMQGHQAATIWQELEKMMERKYGKG